MNDFRAHWDLDPDVVFLNHGSFGACPRVVLEEQQRLRRRMEAEPVRFFVRELPELLDEARRELAAFVNARPEDLVFVPNATTGVNSVLRSLRFAPGDELLVTDHAYNACANALRFVAERSGAKVVVAALPFPLSAESQAETQAEIVTAVLDQVTPSTRLALLDHVTSATGLVLPLAELSRALAQRGVDVLVDGAHAPGMLPVDLPALDVPYYTANCHKWICAPKGAAFLWVRPDRQEQIRPLCISHGANAPADDRSRFMLEFDWTGTDDPTARLCVPTALRFMGGLLPGGFAELMQHNRSQVLAARRLLAETLDVPLPCPDEMIGSLASLPLPAGDTRGPLSAFFIDPLQEALLRRHGVEVPVTAWPAAPRRLLRISSQVYNGPADYAALAHALAALLAEPVDP